MAHFLTEMTMLMIQMTIILLASILVIVVVSTYRFVGIARRHDQRCLLWVLGHDMFRSIRLEPVMSLVDEARLGVHRQRGRLEGVG
jgi:uncharacterized membrane protein YqjE